MKNLLLITLLCVSAFAMAQETASKIPSEAAVVATIKGQNLLQLISMEELNKSFMGKGILKNMNRRKENGYTSLEDFGLNINASSHYFYHITDSISYNAFILPIKDISKFEVFMTQQDKNEIITENGIRFFKEGEETVTAWNDNTLVVVIGKLSESYFADEHLMNQYGLEPEDVYYYEDANKATEVIDVIEGVEEVVEAEDVNEMQVIEDAVGVSETYYNEPEEAQDDSYYDSYNDNYAIKNALRNQWSLRKAFQILSQSENESILKNKSYNSSLDKDAEATLWVSDFGVLYEGLLGGVYNAMGGFNIQNMYANSSMSAKLYAEKDRMQLRTAYTISDQLAESYKKIASKKLNKKFLNYVNEDRMLGYMSYAIDTEAALKEYPAILKSMYGNMPMYGAEASLAVDLFELLLDEEAVAKVFPGDMLFLLSGISKKEMKYTSYEYDDNYEYTEIEKTKTETVPDFLLMISTEDSRMLKKLIDYGTKKDAVVYNNGYYSVKISESPLDVHFLINDGILFVGTSNTEMSKIASNNFDTKLSSNHKKLLRDSNYALFISGKKLASKVPMDTMNEKEMEKISYFIKNASDAYVSSSKIKGNTIEAEMVIEIPETEENSLKYVFNLIETLMK